MRIEPDKPAEAIIKATYVDTEFAATALDHSAWKKAQPIKINRYWSGASAPRERTAEARILWSDTAILVRYVCQQNEPLVISDKPITDKKTIGLWDRDVCEIFLAPDLSVPERYFEFEAAPTGEWIDLAIHTLPDKRETDWEFHSGMTAAARVSLRSNNSHAVRVRSSSRSALSTRASARAESGSRQFPLAKKNGAMTPKNKIGMNQRLITVSKRP